MEVSGLLTFQEKGGEGMKIKVIERICNDILKGEEYSFSLRGGKKIYEMFHRRGILFLLHYDTIIIVYDRLENEILYKRKKITESDFKAVKSFIKIMEGKK